MKTKLEIALELGRQQKINSSISIAEQRHQQLELVEKIFNELEAIEVDDLDEIVAKYVEPRDLKEISTQDLLDELWSRNGETVFILNSFTLEHLKGFLKDAGKYKKGQEKLFCDYLADNDIGCSESCEVIESSIDDFYEYLKEIN